MFNTEFDTEMNFVLRKGVGDAMENVKMLGSRRARHKKM